MNLSALTIISLIFGIGLGLLFLLMVVASFEKTKSASTNKLKIKDLPRICAGAFSSAFGLIMLIAWVYFFYSNFESFMARLPQLLLHATLMLISSLLLLSAGISMILNWDKNSSAFLYALAFVSFSLIISLLQFGNQGHPMLMDGIAIAVMLVLIYFVGLIYSFQHFVFRFDQTSESEDLNS